MEEGEVFIEILHHVRLATRLLALQAVGKTKMSEGAPLLKRLGFSNTDIASIYGTTPKAVSVRLAEAKRRK